MNQSVPLMALVLILFSCYSMAIAGELTFGFINEIPSYFLSSSSEWEPTRCGKPTKPSFYVYDIESYNWAVREYNTYLDEMKNCVSCIVDEGQEDLDTLKQIIQDSIDEKIKEINQEVENVKRELEYSKMFID